MKIKFFTKNDSNFSIKTYRKLLIKFKKSKNNKQFHNARRHLVDFLIRFEKITKIIGFKFKFSYH